MKSLKAFAIGAAVLAGVTNFQSGPAMAAAIAPLGAAQTVLTQSDDAPVIQVRSRRNVGAAIAAGAAVAIIGGIIASQQRHYYEPYYGYGPYYGGPYYAPYPYAGPVYGGGVAYCMRRFKSYDPYSMTYLGYDGFRHPCP